MAVLLLAASTVVSVAENAPGSVTSTADEGQVTVVQPPVADEVPAARVAPLAQPSVRAKATRPSVEAAKSLPEDDYYARRAKSRLVEDAADAAKQVSLQLAYPGHNVVVCEAGCYGGASRIVQFAPKTTTNPAVSGAMQTTAAMIPGRGTVAEAAAADVALNSDASEIRCVAGCYGSSNSSRGTSIKALQAVARTEVEVTDENNRDIANRHTPSQSRRGATGIDASRWMTASARADQPPRRDAGLNAGHQKNKKRTTTARINRLRSNPSGEWFEQIDADRGPRVR